jgi:hypothetical protein
MCLKADNMASCTASSASSGLRSQRIAIPRKRGRNCARIVSNSCRRSGLVSRDSLRASDRYQRETGVFDCCDRCSHTSQSPSLLNL